MGAPLAVSGVMAGIHVSLSRDGKEVDRADKAGCNLDSIDPPVGDRLTNEGAECKRFLARLNVQTRR
jgi:hypothetical protein